ncbi:MAG: HAMP domain-containing histidine kinase [Turicibacter sp.]|nr:HAMP domain-containing histidine kinase [Turicibacter sp.]
MLEQAIQKKNEIIKTGQWKEWHLLWMAIGLAAAAPLFSLAGTLWQYKENAYLLMVIIALMYPLKKVEAGRPFQILQKFPIELPLLASFILWATANSTIWSLSDNLRRVGLMPVIFTIRILAIWFAMFYLTAYTLMTIKKLYLEKSFKENSWLANLFGRFYANFIRVDLKGKLKWQLWLWLLLHGVLLFIFGLIFIEGMNFGDGSVMLLIPLYFIVTYLIARFKIGKVQKHYLRLFGMAEQLSQGNLEVSMDGEFGMFSSLKDELSKVRDGLSEAVEKEVVSERMKTELITNVSHDLKTPLTSIITYLELLKSGSVTAEKQVEYLAIIEQKSQRLKTLIEDVFEMSKVASGAIEIVKEPLNVVSLMKQTLSELADAGLDLRVNVPESPVILDLDGMRTHRIFENLVVNMAKYSLSGTRAYIDIAEGEQGVVIAFKNISALELDLDPTELLERFVRADGARTTEGSGLGLAIAKSLTVIQGGTLDVSLDGDLFKVILKFPK